MKQWLNGGKNMEQLGKIVEILDDNTAKVIVLRHTSCKNCGACHVGGAKSDIIVDAENDADAKLGNLVEVTMETQNVLSAAFIMYVIPLFILLLGIFIGTQLFTFDNGEIYSILLGFVFLAISYFIIRQNENRFVKKYKAVITKIIE